MKIIWTSLLLWLTALTSFGQEIASKNALTLSFGPSSIIRQDLIFSPFIHKDYSLLNIGLDYTREAKSFQKISINYANFNPMVTESYKFTFNGEPEIAYPHNFNLVSLDYQFGKKVKGFRNGIITIGGLFSSDIQAMNYVYGRISNFGYFAALGLGVFGTYSNSITEKSRFEATLKLPLFAWLARSPYLVNDDQFIKNISSHSGLKTFMAFLGDGQMATWDKIQTLDLELRYEYDLNKRWGLGAAYLFEFVRVSQSRNLLSFRNSVNILANFKF
jgi:hypothetical protein